MDPVALLEALRQLPPWVVYAILVGGALLEYVFPPFPGDTVVVVGAALVAAFGWSVGWVFVAVTAGAVLGSALGWAVGAWLRETGRVEQLGPKKRRAVALVVGRFEEYGAAYLALNRFLPGVRSLLFVAAGLAGLRLPVVLAWSALAASLWNGLLIGIGVALGGNVERIAALVQRHNVVAGVLVVLVVTIVVWRTWKAVNTDDDGSA